LKGPVETWSSQLEALYRQKPVFALLGGISSGTWGPIHQFCEKNRVPCIFPVTDLPVVSSDDFYTLYFSKGLYQEGESAAKFLSRTLAVPPETQVVQVYRQDDRSGALARGFADFWKRTGGSAMKARILAAGEVTGKEFWKGLAAANKDAVILVWLGPSDLAGIEELGAVENPPNVIVSASMLAGSLSSLPDAVRDSTYITYPRRLPGEEAYASSVVESWLKFKKIPVTNMTIEAKTYFLSRVLLNVVASLRGDCYRDYFLDLFDVQEEKTAVVAEYPRVTFGPGQRYASKGCYIVTLTKGPQPKIFRQTEWVNY
jgi:ABC-type branched-subunit amino acid transport system substrate-binding protein